MKKSIFLFFAAILCATNAWAWCGNSFITVNGLWCTGSNSYVHDGGKFHGKDLGTLTTLELGGEFQVWPSSTTAGTLCYKIDDGTENSISLPKTGTDGNNSKHSGSGAVDLSGLAGGSHSIAVWFKHGSDIDNNGGSNFVATFTIAAATPDPEPEPIADVTVHFINSVEWAAVACHHWIPGGAGTSWPGDVLSKTDEIAGYDVYTATFTGAHTSCIFNNNNNGNQTGDLTVEDGKYYEVNTNTWYADKAAAEAALATPIPDETVYLINTGNWSKAMIYTWNGVGGTAWPGVEMTLTGETIEGYAVYSYTAKQGGQANLLFQESENVNKTGDLTWEAGKYYAPLKNEWYDTKEAAAEALAAPVEYEYVYLINTNDWAKAHIYTWTPEVAGWPGAAMTKEAEQIAGKDVYSYKVVKGTTFGGMNFNCGGDECKTGDLTWQAGKYYAPSTGEWYADAATAEAALAAVVTYDYYVVGTINGWGLKDASYGMELSGDVYEKEVAFVIGKHELKINNGTWDNANTFGYDNLSVAYEGVSRGSGDGDNNIVIDLAEAKTITIKLDKNTKKITLEGLTQIHTVKATVNPAETGSVEGAKEYKQGEQATLTATPAEGYQFVNWTKDEEVVSTENPYTFTVTADIALVANFQATEPVVELPDASVRAWAYDLALAVEGEQYTFSYKATTAALATLIFTDVDGEELATKDLGLVEAGANTVVLAADELPAGQKVNWAVKLEAGAIANVVEVTDQSRGIYDFYNMMDVLVDNNPESEYFGRIYIQMAYDGANDAATDRSAVQKAGFYLYDQALNELNPESNVSIRPTLPEGYTMGDNRNKFHRLDIDPKTGNLTWCYNVAGKPAVFAVDAANLAGEATNLVAGIEGISRTAAHCFDAEGALYVMDLPAAGTIYKIVNGVATVFAATDSKWVNASMTLAADGKGGLWVAQNRGQLDSYYQLAHVTSAGVIDWSVYDNLGTFVQNQTPGTSSTGWTGGAARGALAYDAERKLLAQGRNGVVEVYSVAYDAETGVPTLTLVASTPTVGTNIDGLHFDYAGDLYVVNSSKEKFQKFAMPTNNNVCTTPAASKYAFQNIEYDTMEITMTNLEVAEMGGYLVLTASDEMETGLNVMLALNEDGSVSEMSYASIISGWMETELPIVEGTITKTYSEELATDVYSGLVVVEYNEGYLGLDLTMYYVAPEYTDIVITNATVTEDIRELGWGDETYTVLLLESTWSDGVETYPVLVEVNDYDLSVVEGTAVVSVTIGGQGDEDPWLGNVPDGEMKYTIADGVITLQGKLENASAWPAPVYWNLTISGKLPQGPTTALDNIAVEAKAIKMIKNGQLIIIKNGVQYNVQGQVIK